MVNLESQAPIKIDQSQGWWNSITAGDFGGDGDIDYLIGNLGLNTRFKASPSEPVCIYAKDFNKDGRIDPVLCYYVQGKNQVYPTRDEIIRQMPAMRLRFQSYKDYATADFDETFTSQELVTPIVKSECFESSYLQNLVAENSREQQLPVPCQFAPVFGMIVGDYNSDGHLMCSEWEFLFNRSFHG